MEIPFARFFHGSECDRSCHCGTAQFGHPGVLSTGAVQTAPYPHEREQDRLSLKNLGWFPPQHPRPAVKGPKQPGGGTHCTLIRYPLHVLIDHSPTLAPSAALGPCHRHREWATVRSARQHRMGSPMGSRNPWNRFSLVFSLVVSNPDGCIDF